MTPAPTLLLVPTELELRTIRPTLGHDADRVVLACCGFGPVAAAARTAHLVARVRPSHVVLAGIAGSYRPDGLPVGSAWCFDRVAIDGVGIGEASSFRSAASLGFPQLAESGVPAGTHASDDTLPLDVPAGLPRQDLLLTCCAASDSAEMASARARRFGAAAEDMEGFGVALSCHIGHVGLTIVRGISNVAGVREKAQWAIDAALAASCDLVRRTLPA